MDVKYEVKTDKTLVKDVVKVILSTILFQRLFGPITPQSREALGIIYPSVVNPSIDTLIEEKASALLRVIEESSGVGEIGIQFFERKSKKATWFGKTHEDVCWEQWVISIQTVVSPNESEREVMRKKTSEKLREILDSIIATVNSKKSHIPPITTTDSTPFPYEIVVIPGSVGNESWGAVFRKILEQ